MSNLMQAFRIISRSAATKSHKFQKPVHMKCWEKDMVKYGLVKYYPRHPDHKDPVFKPTKLLLVQRVKPFYGQPHWDKAMLTDLNLGEEHRGCPFTIVKNTPTECARLWRIKHLLKISAIQVPENFSEEDVAMGGTFLQDNGKFDVIKKVDPVRIELSEQFEKDGTKMDKVTIKRQLRYKWLNPIGSNP